MHEKELEEQHAFDNLEEYESHRRSNVFMTGCFCLAEYALKIDLPDSIFEDERFMKMHWAAVDMIGYSNVCVIRYLSYSLFIHCCRLRTSIHMQESAKSA